MDVLDRDRIYLGCGNFGGIGSPPELIGKGETEAQAQTVLDRATELGIRRFDTANSYGGGLSESILGAWLARQPTRIQSEAHVATKVGNPFGARPGHRPLACDEILAQLHSSLRRLRLERIAVYYIHMPDPRTPLEETINAFAIALKAGDVGEIGASNVDLAYVQKFLELATQAQDQQIALPEAALRFVLTSNRAQYAVIGPRKIEHFSSLGLS